jgi:hypothetical protein
MYYADGKVTLELKHTFTIDPQVETITFQNTATGGIKGIIPLFIVDECRNCRNLSFPLQRLRT